MKISVLTFLVLLNYQLLLGQSEVHKEQIKKIFHQALTIGKSYDWLDTKTLRIGSSSSIINIRIIAMTLVDLRN